MKILRIDNLYHYNIQVFQMGGTFSVLWVQRAIDSAWKFLLDGKPIEKFYNSNKMYSMVKIKQFQLTGRGMQPRPWFAAYEGATTFSWSQSNILKIISSQQKTALCSMHIIKETQQIKDQSKK